MCLRACVRSRWCVRARARACVCGNAVTKMLLCEVHRVINYAAKKEGEEVEGIVKGKADWNREMVSERNVEWWSDSEMETKTEREK